jgi:hypothetical protein
MEGKKKTREQNSEYECSRETFFTSGTQPWLNALKSLADQEITWSYD